MNDQILVVQPGQFGLMGTIKARAKYGDADLVQVLARVAKANRPATKDHRSHTQHGIQLGLDWQSEIPETDVQSIRARQRARGG